MRGVSTGQCKAATSAGGRVGRGLRAAALGLGILLTPGLATAQPPSLSVAEIEAQREELQAYSIGVQGVVYGQPVVDYARLWGEQTGPYDTKGRGRAPVNTFFNFGRVLEPGMPDTRMPNNDTIYFRAWIDLRAAPLVLSAPDTDGRYYNLAYVDFFSETVAQTGRRTTGTKPYKVLIVGPEWKGQAPAGHQLLRMKTHQGMVFGRMLVDGAADVSAANALIRQFSLEPLGPVQPVPPFQAPDVAALDSLAFFGVLNAFLRNTPTVQGEEALLGLFDSVGFGPNRTFDPQALAPATRRGLERAVQDGRAMIKAGRQARGAGWNVSRTYGRYDLGDYLWRATVEYRGLLVNYPEESVYASASVTADGQRLTGDRRYRIVLDKPIPVDAFWSLTPYDIQTLDMIPNPIKRYSIGDRTKGLKRRKDGTLVIELSKTKPTDPNVNWLPIGEGPFVLYLRLYQPRPEALREDFEFPALVDIGPAA